jgi:hypothetical protein
MKFTIARVSRESPPCDGATLETVEGKSKWVIEVADLESLVGLIRKLDDAIILDLPVSSQVPTIEIYDARID